MGKTEIKLIMSLIVSVGLVACGGGGGGGGAGGGVNPNGLSNTSVANIQFMQDMALLKQSRLNNAAQVDATLNGQFSKVFGGTGVADVTRFIEARVKRVYTIEEVTKFKLHLSSPQGNESATYGELMPEKDLKDLLESPTGVNFGTAFAQIQNMVGGKLEIETPQGRLPAGSPRIGLIGLHMQKYTQVTETIPLPLEARIEILTHEGRHSDCSRFDSEECGYSHGICAEGHQLAGLPACDKTPWGAYAVGAIYLRGTVGNYSPNTLEGRIMQFVLDDNISRLQEEHLKIMEASDPDLTSI